MSNPDLACQSKCKYPLTLSSLSSVSLQGGWILVCVLLKLSDYICSDGTNKYFFIIMHYGIIFSCMENFKEQQWPVFFFSLWLFMKVSWKGAAKEDRTYCHDLITVCCRCRFYRIFIFWTRQMPHLKASGSLKNKRKSFQAGLVTCGGANHKKYNMFHSTINWLFWVLKIEDKVLCRDY